MKKYNFKKFLLTAIAVLLITSICTLGTSAVWYVIEDTYTSKPFYQNSPSYAHVYYTEGSDSYAITDCPIETITYAYAEMSFYESSEGEMHYYDESQDDINGIVQAWARFDGTWEESWGIESFSTHHYYIERDGTRSPVDIYIGISS